MCVYYAIFIILACDVYLPDYKYFRSATLDLQLDLGKPSRPKPIQASSVGSPQKRPWPCGWREHGAVYFWKEARMDSFAAVPRRLSRSSMCESTNTD
jgi:hypothetical protein